MKAPMFLLPAILFLSHSLVAQDLKPFDRLSKNYITLDAALGTSGAQPNGPGAIGGTSTTVGSASTTKDYSSIKEVIIKIPVSKNVEGLVVEAYGVYKNYDSKGVRFQKLEVQKVSGQEFRFTLSTKKTVERVMNKATFYNANGSTSEGTVDTGRAVNHGERISGWFARAISQNEIIGVIGSSPQLQAAAGAPNPKPDGK